MNRLSSTPLLALALLLLAAPTRAGDPIQQFGQVLNNTVGQLGLLGASTYNAGSFAQLQNLLANLFGSMMTLSEPYFNNYISQMLAQNAAYIQQIAQLEAKNAASNSVVFQLLNSASATLGSHVANIGATLVLYQNVVNQRLFDLQNSYNSNRQILDQMSAAIGPLNSLLVSAAATTQQVENYIPQINQAFEDALIHFAMVTTVVSSSTSLTPVADTRCANLAVDVSGYFSSRSPYVAATTSSLVSATTTAVESYDTNIISISPTVVEVQICTNSGNDINPDTQPFVVQLACY